MPRWPIGRPEKVGGNVENRGNPWMELVPLRLRRAHDAACWAYKWLHRSSLSVQRAYDLPVPDPDDELTTEEENQLEKRKSVCFDRCARLILSGRRQLSRAERLVVPHAREFASVSRELRQWELHDHSTDDGWYYGMVISRSVHEFAVRMARLWLDECLRGIVAEKKNTSRYCVSDVEVSALTERDIRQFIPGVVTMVEECEEPPSDLAETLRELRGEIRRASRRRTKQREADWAMLSAGEQQIVEVVRQAGRRMTADEILGELERRYGAASQGTTKMYLANLVRHRWLDNRQDVVPKGYGLRDGR